MKIGSVNRRVQLQNIKTALNQVKNLDSHQISIPVHLTDETLFFSTQELLNKQLIKSIEQIIILLDELIG